MSTKKRTSRQGSHARVGEKQVTLNKRKGEKLIKERSPSPISLLAKKSEMIT